VVAAYGGGRGAVAYVTGRFTAPSRHSHVRSPACVDRGVVLDLAAVRREFSDPLLSQAELLTSRAVAGAVVDSIRRCGW